MTSERKTKLSKYWMRDRGSTVLYPETEIVLPAAGDIFCPVLIFAFSRFSLDRPSFFLCSLDLSGFRRLEGNEKRGE